MSSMATCTAADHSGHDNDAAITGASWSSEQPPNARPDTGSLEFDGSYNPASISHDALLSPSTGRISVFGWAKTTQTQMGMVAQKYDNVSPNPGWGLALNHSGYGYQDGTLAARSGDPVAHWTTKNLGAGAINDGQWHHVGFTCDGSTMTLYWEGEAVHSAAVDSNFANTVDVQLGTQYGTQIRLVGNLADIRVYNRALSSEDVAAIYATPPGQVEIEEIRDHNGLNQITRIKEGATKTDLSYDPNGNLLDDGPAIQMGRIFNRLVEVKRASDSAVIGDVHVRRPRPPDSQGDLERRPLRLITNGTTDFLYTGWQCVEERDSSDDPQKQYVWGTYIDELIQQRIDISGTPADQYPLQDLLYRTTALTNSSGTIIEAYDYDAYGNTLIFTATGTGGDWWSDDAAQAEEPTCDFLFTGRRFDPETENYDYRARPYHAQLGRFISTDPLLYWDALSLYVYVDASPLTHVDPSGKGIFVTVTIKKVIPTSKWEWRAIGGYRQGIDPASSIEVESTKLGRPQAEPAQWIVCTACRDVKFECEVDKVFLAPYEEERDGGTECWHAVIRVIDRRGGQGDITLAAKTMDVPGGFRIGNSLQPISAKDQEKADKLCKKEDETADWKGKSITHPW
jgi:RHS repeat-associated protein